MPKRADAPDFLKLILKNVRMFGALSQREQLILTQYYVGKKTYEEIGLEMGLSRERVRQIKLRALSKLSELQQHIEEILPC